MQHEILNAATIRKFIFASAGPKASTVFTIRSVKTGKHFTYKLTRAAGDDETAPWFVKLLNGSNNATDYMFVGTIFPRDLSWMHISKKGNITTDAPSVVALRWFLRQLILDPIKLFGSVQFYHEGRCGRCGRTLTVPESIATGFGPDCAAKLGIDITVLAGREDALDEEKLAVEEDRKNNIDMSEDTGSDY